MWGRSWPQPIGSYRQAQPGRGAAQSWPQPMPEYGAENPKVEDTGGGTFTATGGGFMSPPTQIGNPAQGQRGAQMSQPEPRPQYQPPRPSMPQRRGALYTMGMPSGPAAMIPRGGGPVMSTSSLLDGSNPLVQLLRAAMAQYGGGGVANPYGGGYQPLQSAAGTGGYASDYAPGGGGGNGASATGYLAAAAAPGGGSGLTNPFTGAPVSSYPVAPAYPGMGFTSELIPPAGAATPQTPWYAQPGGPGANPWATDPTLTMNQDQTAMTRSW